MALAFWQNRVQVQFRRFLGFPKHRNWECMDSTTGIVTGAEREGVPEGVSGDSQIGTLRIQ